MEIELCSSVLHASVLSYSTDPPANANAYSERPLESPCLHPLLGELKLGYTPGCLNGLSNRLGYTLDKMTILAAEILPLGSWASSSDSVCHHFAVSTPQPL